MKVVTICGSMKFKDKMMEVARDLEIKNKYVVIQCVYSNDKFNEEEQVLLADLHYKKIDISDAIYVVNVDGYIGTSPKKEIEYANSLGIETIVTDHHEVGDEVPKALAVVDAKRKDNQYPCRDLAGVGVVFKLTQALRKKIRIR